MSQVFYVGYDLYAKDNPHFHDEELYPFDDVEGGNKLRTPQLNNITLMVRRVIDLSMKVAETLTVCIFLLSIPH